MAVPQTFDEAFTRVKELVSIFQQNEERYLPPGYSEAQARLDFIDKFWIALGWDVNHEQQTDRYKQEVRSSAVSPPASFATCGLCFSGIQSEDKEGSD